MNIASLRLALAVFVCSYIALYIVITAFTGK